MKKLIVKGLFWRFVYFISLFVLNILMSRYYLAPGSGQIYYNITLLAWLILILSFSLEVGMNYYLASNQIAAGELTGFALLWSFLAGLVSFIFLKIFIHKVLLTVPGFSFWYIYLAYIIGNLLISFFSALFYASKNFVISNIILSISNCILIIIIPKHALSNLRDGWFIFAYFSLFLISGIGLFALFYLKNESARKIRIPGLTKLKMLFKISLWAFVTNALTMVLYRVDYWYVKNSCSASELGNYIQASKVGQIFLLMPSVASVTIFSITASGLLINAVENIQSLARSLFYIACVPAIALLIFGKWIFPLLFGVSFELMYIPFSLLLPGILAFCLIAPITSYYGGKKILHVNLISIIISVFFVIVSDALAVPKFGFKAAAVVSSLGYLIYAVCLLVFFKKHHQVSLKNFFTLQLSDFDWLKGVLIKKRV